MNEVNLDHPGPWTEAKYFALETDERIELIDGNLIVTPPPDVPHQLISWQLAALLWPYAKAAGLLVVEAIEVRLATGRVTIPDVIVADTEPSGRFVEGGAVLLVSEITSPSNARHDRIAKMRYYAEAQIPWYLLVEPNRDGQSQIGLRLHRLDGDRYVEHATADGSDTLIVEKPFLLEIRPTDLLSWRHRSV